jgi:hypothetical protein
MLWNLRLNSIFCHITPCSPLKVSRRFVRLCHLFSRWFLTLLILRPWIWRWYIPLKLRLIFSRIHGVVSRKIEFFITTGVRTSNPIDLKSLRRRLRRLPSTGLQRLAVHACSSPSEHKTLRPVRQHLPKNIVTYKGLAWRIVVGSGFYDWIYWTLTSRNYK